MFPESHVPTETPEVLNDGSKNAQSLSAETLKHLFMMTNTIDDNQLSLNESHISEMLSQRRTVTEYIHEDRKQESWDRKFFFVGCVIVWLIVFGLVLVFYKEQIVTILAATTTFLGGYGLGSKTKGRE